MQTKKQMAVDFIYNSYMKAEKYLKYSDTDSVKRHPHLTKSLIESIPAKTNIIVTGSKGKGSVSAITEILLRHISGCNTGLFTSPHIENFNERIRINGKNISDDDLFRLCDKIRPQIMKIEDKLDSSTYISPMGIQTAVALNFFYENRTIYNVFECGKGVKFDDVNNISADYAVINPIFLEHTRELGDTIEKIALDKCEIIKSDRKIIYSAKQQKAVAEILKKKADSCGVRLKEYGTNFGCKNIKFSKKGMIFDVYIENETLKDVFLPMLGIHQAENCALAIAVCYDILGEINVESVNNALKNFKWRGRLEILSENPFVLLDACINRQSAVQVKAVFKELQINKAVFIIGIPDDKDYIGVVETFADVAEKIILTKSDNKHYKFSKDIQLPTVRKIVPDVEYAEDIYTAYKSAKRNGEVICILGTTSLISNTARLKNF